MENKTRHFCKCGDKAVVEDRCTGNWYCLSCGLDEMLEDIRRGDPVKVAFGSSGVTDVFVVPGDDKHEPDLLAPLADAVKISFCRN